MKKNYRFMDGADVFYFLICGIFIIYLFMAFIYRPINKVVNEKEVVVTVTDKGIKNFAKKSKYLIFAQDESGETQVFEITDSLLKFRFNSADVYGKIQKDKTYRITVCGSRIPIFSWYPNIYNVEELSN